MPRELSEILADPDRTAPVATVVDPKVLVVDDDPLALRVVCESLRDGGIEVVGEATSASEAIALATELEPDVVLLDMVMPAVDGIATTRQLVALDPSPRVVVITSSYEEDFGVLVLRAGACGFVGKSIPVEALPRIVQAAVSGEAIVSRRLAMRVISSLRRVRDDRLGVRPVHSTLTGREWEVLDMLSASMSTDAIATTLGLSTETVRSHVKAVLRKLGVNSREDAVVRATELREELLTQAAVP